MLPEGDGQSDPQNTDMDRTLLDLTKFSMSNKGKITLTGKTDMLFTSNSSIINFFCLIAPENWAKGKYLGSGAFGQVLYSILVCA